ncbi:MAG: class I SAM-dependent methyltransferase [Flavobacteriales bacterium]|jgi:SAM-dependent methyltransferase|nr:class I SAM-dependent methyltransferase [Flavobacteriales bacterium]
MNCTLCSTQIATSFFSEKGHSFFSCPTCGSVLRGLETFPTPKEEIMRYEEHNNDVNDLRYQKFVSPITDAVQKSFFSESSIGLDFGAGTGPVITKVLRDKGYKLNLYDPFFIPDTAPLQQKYDFVACCEVIEHFHHPLKEFKLLHSLLKRQGKLFCMTDIYAETIDFSTWYYKNDPTHVIFYTEKSLQWIKKEVGFKELVIEKRLIVFS